MLITSDFNSQHYTANASFQKRTPVNKTNAESFAKTLSINSSDKKQKIYMGYLENIIEQMQQLIKVEQKKLYEACMETPLSHYPEDGFQFIFDFDDILISKATPSYASNLTPFLRPNAQDIISKMANLPGCKVYVFTSKYAGYIEELRSKFSFKVYWLTLQEGMRPKLPLDESLTSFFICWNFFD